MKKFLITIALVISVISCTDPSAYVKINGTEEFLPPELKGLKIYSVDCGNMDIVKVAVLENEVIGTQYAKGKMRESLIIVKRGNETSGERIIECSSIISENDSIIVVRK